MEYLSLLGTERAGQAWVFHMTECCMAVLYSRSRWKYEERILPSALPDTGEDLPSVSGDNRKEGRGRMKYDLLEPFREYLYEQLPANTARTYYSAVVKLFKDIQFHDFSRISSEWIIQEAAGKFRTRNEFSAVKNGLKRLGEYYPDLQLPKEEEFLKVSRRKRNYSKKPAKVIYLKPTQRKINQICNERLRYAYRLALISGLRVSELADLEADDIVCNEEQGTITVKVKKGKGGHGGTIECAEDRYLLQRLPGFLEKHKSGKIFYSEAYMREQAAQLGMECHDLRRIFAIQSRNELKKEMKVEEANEIVQQKLRHVRFSTTKRYLFNRKLRFEYEERVGKIVNNEFR